MAAVRPAGVARLYWAKASMACVNLWPKVIGGCWSGLSHRTNHSLPVRLVCQLYLQSAEGANSEPDSRPCPTEVWKPRCSNTRCLSSVPARPVVLLWILGDVISINADTELSTFGSLIVGVVRHVASGRCLSFTVAEFHKPLDIITVLVVTMESAGSQLRACMGTYMVSRPIGIDDRRSDDHITLLHWRSDVYCLRPYARGSDRYRVRVAGSGIAHPRQLS